MNAQPALPAALHDDLERYVAVLERCYGADLVSVVLFGSRARGEAKPESDIDVLVVVRGLPRNRFERYGGRRDLAREVSNEFALVVTPILLTPEEAQDGFAVGSPRSGLVDTWTGMATSIGT